MRRRTAWRSGIAVECAVAVSAREGRRQRPRRAAPGPTPLGDGCRGLIGAELAAGAARAPGAGTTTRSSRMGCVTDSFAGMGTRAAPAAARAAAGVAVFWVFAGVHASSSGVAAGAGATGGLGVPVAVRQQQPLPPPLRAPLRQCRRRAAASRRCVGM